MGKSFNSMDLFKVLPKTNCRECGSSTCLAFSVLVFKGENSASDCPYLSEEIIEKFGGTIASKAAPIPGPEEALNFLKEKLGSVDLEKAAERTGGHYSDGRLTLKIFGKDFAVDSEGQFFSDLHVNLWIVAPVLSYILSCKDTVVSEAWVPFRELAGGKDRSIFFEHKCEKPLKKLADSYTDLFEDMMDIFNGTQVENHYESDISLILWPLPGLPMLVCYWKPDEGLGSDLNLFFDVTAEEKLDIDAIHTLGTGLVTMFEKIARRHG